MTAPVRDDVFPWSLDAKKLKGWFAAYLLTVSAGLYWAIDSKFENGLGVAVMALALVPYIVAVVFAYRVQNALNKAKLYKGGAWQIIAGALLLNPFLLGFVIPASVLWATRRIERRIRDGKIDYQPVGVP